MEVRIPSIRNATAALATAAVVVATVGVMSYVSTRSDAAEASTTHSVHRNCHVDKRSRQAVKFRNQMRKLWEDHIVWTRQFIVTSAADLPDANTAAANR